MDKLAVALAERRRLGFWLVGGTALLLTAISWIDRVIVAAFNTTFFHRANLEAPGWWLYLGFRLPIAAFFLWTVVRLPESRGQSNHEAVGIKDKRYFDPLMGLRALACLIVLMGHYFMVVFSFVPTSLHKNAEMLLRSCPWAGVWLFFVLSGYLMGKGFARGRYTLNEAGTRLFLRNRMLRIAPIYYASILLVSVYRYPVIFQPRHWWILLELAIFDYRGDLPINPIGALWSVSTEVQFYLLVPLFMVALLYLRRWSGKAFILAPILLTCAGTAGRMWIARSGLSMYSYGYAPLIPNLDLFITGMSINLLLPPPSRVPSLVRERLGPLLLAGGVGFYVMICCIMRTLPRFHMRLEDLWAEGPLLGSLFAGAFIYVAEIRGKIAIARGVSGRFLLALQGIGTLTYCLYVFHPEVFIVQAEQFPRVHSLGVSLAQFPLVVFLTFAVASFFYFAVEKPFDQKKRVSGTSLEDAP